VFCAAQRNSHSYLLVDRIEDRTPEDALRIDGYADRKVIMYGYVRGTFMKPGGKVCVCGAGDYQITRLTSLMDPCPLPNKTMARKLNEKQKMLYAPMGDLGESNQSTPLVLCSLGRAGRAPRI
jgi:ribosome biogenesis protein BMS1